MNIKMAKSTKANLTKSTKSKMIKKSEPDVHNECDVDLKTKKNKKKKKKKKNEEEGIKHNNKNTTGVRQISDVTNAELELKNLKRKKQKDDEHPSHVTRGGVAEIKQIQSKYGKGKGRRVKNDKNCEPTFSKKKGQVIIEGGSQGSSVDFVLQNKQAQSKKRKRETGDAAKCRTEECPKKMRQTELDCLSTAKNNFTENRECHQTKKRKEAKRKMSISNTLFVEENKQGKNVREARGSKSSYKKRKTKKKKKELNLENNKVICKDNENNGRNSNKSNELERGNKPTAILANPSQIGEDCLQRKERRVGKSRVTETSPVRGPNDQKQMKAVDNQNNLGSVTNELIDQKQTKVKDNQNKLCSVANKQKNKSSSKKRRGSPKTLKKNSTMKSQRKTRLPCWAKKTVTERDRMEEAFSIQHLELSNHIKDELYPDTADSSSFAVISAMLKECILGERWGDANRLLCTMCLYMDHNPDFAQLGLFKCGAHILLNHPSRTTNTVEEFYLLMRKIDCIHPYQEKLEHALYLIHQDRMRDALIVLTEFWSTSRLQYTFNPKREVGIWKKICFAYAGLLEYYQWYESTKTRNNDNHGEEGTSNEEAMIRKRALNHLSQLQDEPGIWDIFITKQIEMLEAEGSINEAKEALTKYIQMNPRNPNAHVYLYQFLKRNRSPVEKIKPVLKELATRLPAEDYTLEYIDLLEKNDCAELAEVLPLLFNMADYSSCRYNTALWETLVEHVVSIAESKKETAIALLKECWTQRKSWWTSYHFNKHDASDLVKRDTELAFQKAILAAILIGSDIQFVQKIQDELQKEKPELVNDLENEVSLWNKPVL